MNSELIFALPIVLDSLPADTIVVLCDISTTMRNICFEHLKRRVRVELNNPKLILNESCLVADFVRLMSLKPGFVVRGVERFIGFDEALYRAIISRDESLINYFMCQSPEVDKGYNSNHAKLVALVATLEEN